MKRSFTLSGRSHRSRLAVCSTGLLLSLSSLQTVSATAVDSELLLLVDVSKGLSNADFTAMTEGIANTFRSSSVIASIQSGSTGSIAASLVFWSGNNKQHTAVSWVSISDSVSAEAFAQSVENAARPWSNKKTALGDAMRDTRGYFGDETGGPANGFESVVQMVNVLGGAEDNNTPPGNNRSGAVADARDLSIASGIDVINAIAVTQGDPNIASYYNDFVVGGSVGGTVGSVTSAADYSSIEAAYTPLLASALTQAALTTVPEPSTVTLSMLSACGLLFLRRR